MRIMKEKGLLGGDGDYEGERTVGGDEDEGKQ
jgi:hypothetical protein